MTKIRLLEEVLFSSVWVCLSITDMKSLNGEFQVEISMKYQLNLSGVLQRFGVAYLITSLVVVFIPVRPLAKRKYRSRYREFILPTHIIRDVEEDPLLEGPSPPGMFDDIIPFVYQWLVNIFYVPFEFLYVDFD